MPKKNKDWEWVLETGASGFPSRERMCIFPHGQDLFPKYQKIGNWGWKFLEMYFFNLSKHPKLGVSNLLCIIFRETQLISTIS